MRRLNKITEDNRSATQRHASRLLRETARLAGKEDIFPKRGRWLGVSDWFNLISQYHTLISTANYIRVNSILDYALRHSAQVLALSILMTSVGKLGDLQIIFSVDPDKLLNWIRIVDECERVLNGWIKSDEKRYNEMLNLQDGLKSVDSDKLLAGVSKILAGRICIVPEPLELEQRS